MLRGGSSEPSFAPCPNLCSEDLGLDPSRGPRALSHVARLKPAGVSRREQPRASGKSAVVNCSGFMGLPFPSGEQGLFECDQGLES